MNYRLLLFSLFITTCRLFAQHDTILPTPKSNYYIGVSDQYGFLWTHRYNMGHLVRKHIISGELDVYKTTTGNKAWHQPYHFATAGFSVHVIPLGNPDELGSAIGFYPYVNFPLGKRARNFKMNMRFGWGVGWITRPFDPLENHKNVAIGSHLNTCLALRLNGMWEVNKLSAIEFGIGITHFSNGCMTLPNLGLNLPMVSIGYFFNTTKQSQIRDAYHVTPKDSPSVKQIKAIIADHSWHVFVYLATGMNDIDPPGGRRFGVMNFKSAVLKQTSRKSRWGMGLDVMYSQAIQHKLVYDTVDVDVFGSLQPGVKVCYEWVLGRITFPIEMGVYLYTRYKINGPIYSRFGAHYLVGEHLIFTFDLKTHFAKAEYFEFGVGWRFGRRPTEK